MARRTKHIVYVDGDSMDRPEVLVDAAMACFINKGMDTLERKKFLAEYIKAPTDKHRLAVVDAWVQVRDVASFPFRKGKGGSAGADVGEDATDSADAADNTDNTDNEDTADADEGDTGGVPVDNHPDGEPE